MSPSERQSKREVLIAMLFEIASNYVAMGISIARLNQMGVTPQMAAESLPSNSEMLAGITPDKARSDLAKHKALMSEVLAERIDSGMALAYHVNADEAIESGFGSFADLLLDFLSPDSDKVESLLASLDEKDQGLGG
jgi:hypothetical protein